jgi:hypothetical protein
MKNTLRKRLLFGYPLNMTFTDVKTIVEKVCDRHVISVSDSDS